MMFFCCIEKYWNQTNVQTFFCLKQEINHSKFAWCMLACLLTDAYFCLLLLKILLLRCFV